MRETLCVLEREFEFARHTSWVRPPHRMGEERREQPNRFASVAIKLSSRQTKLGRDLFARSVAQVALFENRPAASRVQVRMIAAFVENAQHGSLDRRPNSQERLVIASAIGGAGLKVRGGDHVCA
jgi:hypothetical protein